MRGGDLDVQIGSVRPLGFRPLRREHGDPFDRILYAQARYGGFRLLSIDRTLAAFGSVVITPR